MPEINIDARNFESYKQCEIRRPSSASVLHLGDRLVNKSAGYYFDIIWIKADLARKGNNLQDGKNNIWAVHEIYGTKRMPGGRENFKQVVLSNQDL